jgi:hypothetical protein
MALSDDFRTKAKQNVDGSVSLFEVADFATDPKKQAMAVIGQVNATIYSALADMLEQSGAPAGADPLVSVLSRHIARNAAIRKAAFSGTDAEFNDAINGTDSTAKPSGTE